VTTDLSWIDKGYTKERSRYDPAFTDRLGRIQELLYLLRHKTLPVFSGILFSNPIISHVTRIIRTILRSQAPSSDYTMETDTRPL
jgi:hypothetical protein